MTRSQPSRAHCSQLRWGDPEARILWLLAGALQLATGAMPATAQDQPSNAQAESQRTAAIERELVAQKVQIEALRSELERQRSLSPAAATDQPLPPEAPADNQAAPVSPDDPELAALLADAKKDAETAPPSESALRIYGFADVGLQRIWSDDEIAVLEGETDALTFVLGNVNLYFDAQPWKDWRFLAELRFGLFPDGSVPRPAGGYTFAPPLDTSYSDPSAANGGFTILKWAGVFPQRAHIDWTPSDAFNLRTGLFLTPYGIWNVDHGTPTRMMATEPLIITSQLMPNQLLGMEAFGTLPALPWTLGYHVHVSNGRTVGQVDLTDNKAVGGRFFASTRSPIPMKLGVSGYWGTSEDEERSAAGRTTTFAYTEYALAADVSLDIQALRIRSELITAWTIYEDGKRRELLGLPLADVMRVGAYLALAYRLPWYGLEPLVMLEWLQIPIPRALPVGEGVLMGSLGLNVYFTPATMLRTQFSLAHGLDFSDHPVETRGSLYQCVARLITTF